MTIPSYPQFIPIAGDLINEINAELSLASDGVSEFTFAGLYLFRNRYQYNVSRLDSGNLIISGIQPPHDPDEKSRAFFMTPNAVPEREILLDLFKKHDYWKNIPDSVLLPNEESFREWGIEISEDRGNFDYLYLRSDLAFLKGRKFHKKRNLVAQFNSAHLCIEKPLTAELIPDAMEVLEAWKEERVNGDYGPAREALELFGSLDMTGSIYYIDNSPAAWCLGEPVAHKKIFAIHFEKALDKYKGIYQYINQAFALMLPEHISHINREQDLGDEGLRQAKMSYRPSGFVRKHTGVMVI